MVCWRCSDYKAALQYDGNRVNRVCRGCYTVLVGGPDGPAAVERKRGILEVWVWWGCTGGSEAVRGGCTGGNEAGVGCTSGYEVLVPESHLFLHLKSARKRPAGCQTPVSCAASWPWLTSRARAGAGLSFPGMSHLSYTCTWHHRLVTPPLSSPVPIGQHLSVINAFILNAPNQLALFIVQLIVNDVILNL